MLFRYGFDSRLVRLVLILKSIGATGLDRTSWTVQSTGLIDPFNSEKKKEESPSSGSRNINKPTRLLNLEIDISYKVKIKIKIQDSRFPDWYRNRKWLLMLVITYLFTYLFVC